MRFPARFLYAFRTERMKVIFLINIEIADNVMETMYNAVYSYRLNFKDS